MFKTQPSLQGLLLIAIATLFSVLLLTPVRAATIYYIATNGDDNNPGTQDQPLATLNQAARKVAAGDTVYVRKGTYTFSGTQYIGSVGTSSEPITYQAYPGEEGKVKLDGSKMPDANSVVNVAGQHNVFKGFEIQNSKLIGIVSWGGKHIKILNNTIHDSYKDAIFVGFTSDFTSTTDILIDGNTAYNNALINRDSNGNSKGGDSSAIIPAIINSYGASNVTITNNRVYKNYGIGIDFILTKGGLAAKNVVYDNYAGNLYLDNATDVTVEENFICTTNDKRFYWRGWPLDGQPAGGIQAANESYGISNPLNRNTIRNNIVIGGYAGFYYGSYLKGGGLKNFVIVNNTFYKATKTLLFIDNDTGHTNNFIANNIFYQTGDGAMTNLTAANSALGFQNNLWYGGSAGGAAGSGDVKADPKLFNPGTTTDGDYKLQAGSPAIDAGIQLQEVVPNDYAGSSRPRGRSYDIGAFEYIP
jgi:parallel beta-helix repeat protein